MWEALGEQTVDVLIIGGGINGAGIARDAAKRGLSVALVDMNDLASGTSSSSSKLIHGGIRYLEQLEFGLVFESVSERRILMDIAPHLVNPLGFLFPVFKESRRALTTISAGMWLYEGLSLFRSPKRHKTLNRNQVKQAEPALDVSSLKGAPLYYDCSTDDARMTLESALDAAQHGAIIATWVKATSFLRDEHGRVCGCTVMDTLHPERPTRDVRASVVINATGPWTDRILRMSQGDHQSLLRPTKGIHAVVTRQKLPVNNAVVCFHPEDGRVLFAIPWGEHTYLGTTDTDFEGDPALVCADIDDINYLLDVSNVYFPEHQLTHEDIISTWAGLRPLIRPVHKHGKEVDESSVSREHQILVSEDGIITVAGGKLTTYRKMSREVMETTLKVMRLSNTLPDRALTEAPTDRDPLPGAVGWPEDDDHQAVANQVMAEAQGKISAQSARHLADTYGMRGLDIARLVAADSSLNQPLCEGRPEILAQVHYAVSTELAATVTDVLERRTQLFYRAHDQGLQAAHLVADTMRHLLGWDDAMTRQMIQSYQEAVALSRQWKQAL